MKTLWEVLLFFIPHWTYDEVAILQRPDGDFDMVCSLLDVQPGEVFDGVVSVNSFVFMFWGWPTGYNEKEQMDIRPWPKEAK